MTKWNLPATSLLAVLATGCNSNHEPSKPAFAKVIQQSHFDNYCELLTLPPPFQGKFPITLELDKQAFNPARDAQPQYDALVAAGLLSVEDGTTLRQQWNKQIQVPTRTYSLSTQGGDYLQSRQRSTWSGRSGFCLTTYKVDEVKHFTVPGEVQGVGMTITQVAYTYSPDTVSEWARHDAVQSAFPEIKRKLASGQSDNTMLALTSDGWMDMKDLK